MSDGASGGGAGSGCVGRGQWRRSEAGQQLGRHDGQQQVEHVGEHAQHGRRVLDSERVRLQHDVRASRLSMATEAEVRRGDARLLLDALAWGAVGRKELCLTVVRQCEGECAEADIVTFSRGAAEKTAAEECDAEAAEEGDGTRRESRMAVEDEAGGGLCEMRVGYDGFGKERGTKSSDCAYTSFLTVLAGTVRAALS